jgi:hypothetical protein
MADAKTKPTAQSARDFLAAVPDPRRRADAQELARIFQRATGEKPVMWGAAIVGFGSYHYRYDTGREGDMCIAGFSPRSGAFALYVLSGAKQESALLERLGKHDRGKACLYVKRLADVDRNVLEELVRTSSEHTRKTQQCDVCVQGRAAPKARRAASKAT